MRIDIPEAAYSKLGGKIKVTPTFDRLVKLRSKDIQAKMGRKYYLCRDTVKLEMNYDEVRKKVTINGKEFTIAQLNKDMQDDSRRWFGTSKLSENNVSGVILPLVNDCPRSFQVEKGEIIINITTPDESLPDDGLMVFSNKLYIRWPTHIRVQEDRSMCYHARINESKLEIDSSINMEFNKFKLVASAIKEPYNLVQVNSTLFLVDNNRRWRYIKGDNPIKEANDIIEQQSTDDHNSFSENEYGYDRRVDTNDVKRIYNKLSEWLYEVHHVRLEVI